MRISAAIKERLEENAARLQAIKDQQEKLTKAQQIELEYLQMESQTFQEMLLKAQSRWWRLFMPSKKWKLLWVIVGMSIYVVAIFHIFQEMDLRQVEQWQFAVTTIPFWLIFTIIPLAIITLLTSRDSRF